MCVMCILYCRHARTRTHAGEWGRGISRGGVMKYKIFVASESDTTPPPADDAKTG